MIDLTRYKTLIFVFHMPDCPACEEYLPTFQEVAKVYERCIPTLVDRGGRIHATGNAQAAVLILNAVDERFTKHADHFRISETPTTVVLFRTRHDQNFQMAGVLDAGETNRLFVRAMHGLSCEI